MDADNNYSEPVQHAIPASSIHPSLPKSTITKRNIKAKKGLGAKKVGGLGGKKVTKADFEKLEKTAEEQDQIKHRLSVSSDGSNLAKAEEPSGESLRLAYQDLSLQEKQDDMKLNKMEKNKKEQAQRLGMGMGRTDGVSHSVAMVTIDQVDPGKRSRRGKYRDGDDTFYDSHTGTNRNRRFLWDESDSEDNDDSSSGKADFSYSVGSKSNKPPPSYSITPIGDGHKADSSVFLAAKIDEPKQNRQRYTKKTPETKRDDITDKYKGAKAISSDMLFGTADMSNERSRNFEGRSAISSDDYYGRSSSPRQPTRGHVEGIKDGVREGVRSVAGKLSNIASDLATSIQDRYS